MTIRKMTLLYAQYSHSATGITTIYLHGVRVNRGIKFYYVGRHIRHSEKFYLTLVKLLVAQYLSRKDMCLALEWLIVQCLEESRCKGAAICMQINN